MSENRKSQEIIDELIKISSEEKEEKEAKIIELKKDVETKYYGIKKPLIIEAKDALIKEGFRKEKITAEIIRRLEGYITESYIRKCIDDPELKDASKVRKQIEVANTGEQIASSDGEDDNNKMSAREEYEKNKYYKNLPSIKNTTLPNTQSNNSMVGQSQNAYNQEQNNQIEVIAKLKQKIETMEQEREMHTTVIIGKNLFADIQGFIEDKKTKRMFIDFDENMAATKVRIEV